MGVASGGYQGSASGDAGDYVLVREFNAAAKRAGLDATAVDLESSGMKGQKKIDGKNKYVIRVCGI